MKTDDKIINEKMEEILQSSWAKKHRVIYWIMCIGFVIGGLTLFFIGIHQKESTSPFENVFGILGMIFWGISLASIPIYMVVICLVAKKHALRSFKRESTQIKQTILGLSKNGIELTPEEFFKIKSQSSLPREYNFAGVYIIFNESKNMPYVGQGSRVFDRVGKHFSGKGNGDVYADYKHGDKFKIKMISLKDSDCFTLNELERKTIMTFDANNKGYNKTRGNVN